VTGCHWWSNPRLQASLTLIYHAAVLAVPCLLRLVRATRRPFAGMVTVFGDGCAMMAVLNTLVMLDTAHEGYCHSPPPRGTLCWAESGSPPAVSLTPSQTLTCARCLSSARVATITT
jgi:hypothetical protein